MGHKLSLLSLKLPFNDQAVQKLVFLSTILKASLNRIRETGDQEIRTEPTELIEEIKTDLLILKELSADIHDISIKSRVMEIISYFDVINCSLPSIFIKDCQLPTQLLSWIGEHFIHQAELIGLFSSEPQKQKRRLVGKELANQIRPSRGTEIDLLTFGLQVTTKVDRKRPGYLTGITIAKALKFKKTLTLSVIYTKLGSEGGIVLAQELKENTTLVSLALPMNSLGLEGGIAIAEMLPRNTTLTTVNLKCNQMGPGAGIAVAKALETNATLLMLDLTGNQLGSEAGIAIGKSLLVNATLKKLDLSYNELGSEVAGTIEKVLIISTSLETLGLSVNPLSDRVRDRLRSVNSRIQLLL